MKRSEFLSFMPFVAAFNKPKLTTDFDEFKSFVRSFEPHMTEAQLQEWYKLEESVYKALFNAAIKNKNVQICYLTANKVELFLEPFGLENNNFTCVLNHSITPTGYILTIFKSQKPVGKIQFIKL